jgi:hypothetical protein
VTGICPVDRRFTRFEGRFLRIPRRRGGFPALHDAWFINLLRRLRTGVIRACLDLCSERYDG